MTNATAKRFNRILLTGAAGALGRQLRGQLAGMTDNLRLSDRDSIEQGEDKAEIITADLADADAMLALTENVDAVVHMGGQSREGPWQAVLNSNIIGLYNLYEGCRKNGVGRVVWASSLHSIGFTPRRQRVDAASPVRPDSNYGVSKVFGEAVAQYYWDKYGLESVSMRIYSCFPEPADRRMLATWLSYDDLRRLVHRALVAPEVGHTIIYGVSDNQEQLADNHLAAHLGFRPQDSAESHRQRLEATTPQPAQGDPMLACHGGLFCADGHHDDNKEN